MGQDSTEIRQEIEQTRGRMTETVEAIGYKTDVPARARDKKDELVGKVTGAKGSVMGTVSDRTPSPGDVKGGARRAKGAAEDNPWGLAIAGLAFGLLAGLVAPSTRIEDERIGEIADQAKEKARETGQEALERGKAVAGDAAQAATETARERASEEGESLKASARESAQEVGSTGGTPGASGRF